MGMGSGYQSKKAGAPAGSRQQLPSSSMGGVPRAVTQPQIAPVQQGPDSPGMIARPAVMPPNPNQQQLNANMQADYLRLHGQQQGAQGTMPQQAQGQPQNQAQQQARAGLEQYNQFNQMGQQFLDSQPFNQQLQQQFREAQDQGYKQLRQQNPGAGIDQQTYEGFQLANALRAAKPKTNAAGWNDVARARSRSQQFANYTPEQFAQRQADIQRQLQEARTGRVTE